MGYLIETVYFLTAALFILGLKRMSHPTTARSGIIWAGYGMVLATVVSFVHPQITAHIIPTNYVLMVIAIAIGGAIAWYGAKKVAMTAMPQMIAIYNGMGGGAAAAIAAVELLKDHGSQAVAPATSHPDHGGRRGADRRGVVLRLGGGVRQVAGTQIFQG
jgi:NAD(P) transhydrogenase subunit beta